MTRFGGMAEVGRMQTDAISKTITQARFGTAAEAGRKWRGEEKKDRRARDVALASGAVGTGGGITAIAAHRKRPVPMADRRIELGNASSAAWNEHATAQQAHERMSRAHRGARALSEAHGKKGVDSAAALRVLRREMGIGGQKHPIRVPKHKQALGGSLITHLGEQAKVTEAKEHAARKVRDTAKTALTTHEGEFSRNAERIASYPKSLRIKRAGLGVAALGAAGALAAGVKAERDRKPLSAVRKAIPHRVAGVPVRNLTDLATGLPGAAVRDVGRMTPGVVRRPIARRANAVNRAFDPLREVRMERQAMSAAERAAYRQYLKG